MSTKNPMKIGKPALIDRLVCRLPQYSKAEITETINALTEEMIHILAREQKVVELYGFGKFTPQKQNKRKDWLNPVTCERTTLKEHFRVTFKAQKKLKEAMNKLPRKKSN